MPKVTKKVKDSSKLEKFSPEKIAAEMSEPEGASTSEHIAFDGSVNSEDSESHSGTEINSNEEEDNDTIVTEQKVIIL